MPQRPGRDEFACAPMRRLLILFILIAIASTSTASAVSRAAERTTASILPTTTGSEAANTATIVPLYLPIIKAPPPCTRVYSANSPWNTKLGPSPTYDPQSDYYIGGITGLFGSDATQYTFPVYEVTSDTPQRTVYISAAFSNVIENDTRIIWQDGGNISAPIPAGALPSIGTDGNIIFWNRQTGDEWGFWQTSANADGSWQATNGYHYNTNWDGVPPTNSSHFVSRGLGGPYLAGLIRPCEIAQGHIDHALAFAYDNPSPAFVYPAVKSDGIGSGAALPEGARLQLDPKLSDAQIRAWGCIGSCLLIAHALQQYGMIVVDRSDHPKIYVEHEATAGWSGRVTSATISSIPYSAFKVLMLQ
jgi:hypothetical protein